MEVNSGTSGGSGVILILYMLLDISGNNGAAAPTNEEV